MPSLLRVPEHADTARETPGRLCRLALGMVGGVLAAIGFACSPSSTTSPSSTASTTTAVSISTVTLSPTKLVFPINAMAGSTQTVTLTNDGSTLLTITSIVVGGGNFSEADDCGTSVSPAAACTITVTFNPVAAGSGGTLTITHDASGSPQTVAITGPNVLGPGAILTPSSLAFGSQAVGTTSPAQPVTLTNPVNGVSAPLTISRELVAGDFAIAGNACGSSLPAGASCTFSVTFTPLVQGVQFGAVSIITNASRPMQSVSLSGTGQ